MPSFLIVSKNTNQLDQQLQNLYEKFGVRPLDITVLEKRSEPGKTAVKSPSISKSIGIEDIRTFQEKIFLTPITSETKAMVIKNAELLTLEAQNALLKVLEEPPQHTIIVLVTTHKNQLLPTILSRCFIIETQEGPTVKKQAVSAQELSSLFEAGIGKRLKEAQDIAKSKEEALGWLERAIGTMRQVLLDSPTDREQTSHRIRTFQKTYTTIKTTNVNLRLTIENLFISS